MADFGELLNKGKQNAANGGTPTPSPKQNAFANLKSNLDKTKENSGKGFQFKPKTAPAQQQVPEPDVVVANVPAEDATELPQKVSVPASSAEPVSEAGDFSSQQPSAYQEESLKQIKTALKVMRENMNNADAVAQSTKLILTEVEEHPDLRQFLLPEDCGMMVRAVRESYGVAIAKKTQRKERVTATSKAVDDVLGDLADMNLDFGS